MNAVEDMKGCAVTIWFESSECVFTTVLGPQLYNKMIHKRVMKAEKQLLISVPKQKVRLRGETVPALTDVR